MSGPASGTTGGLCHMTGRGDDGSHTRLDGPHDLDDALATPDAGLNPIACANLR
jgi:hypothetical protein